MRFIITGSGRCGTKYIAQLLTAAGVPCGHEQVHTIATVTHDEPIRWKHWQADSSWMALHHLPRREHPVVLLHRHPLAVVKSWVEIGYFTWHDQGNPCHGASRKICPDIYDRPTPAQRALAMWTHWNLVALRHAELIVPLHRLAADPDQLARILRWAGHPDTKAAEAHRAVGIVNRHENLRAHTRITSDPKWSDFPNDMAAQAGNLAVDLGYDPDKVPT